MTNSVSNNNGVENGVERAVSSTIALIVACAALLLSAIPIVNNFAFVLAIVALIFSFVGLSKTKKGHKKGRKTSIIALVIAVIAAAIVLASQAFYGKPIDDASKDIQKTVDNSTGQNTDNLLGNDVTVVFGEFKTSTGEYGIISTELPVKVTNKNSETKSYMIKIEAVDQSGNRISDDILNVDSLRSNQSQDFKAFQYVESEKVDSLKSAEFKVVEVSQY